MLSVKQGSIKYHFLSLWYDSTWDWNLVSRAIGEHSNHLTQTLIYYNFANKLVNYQIKFFKPFTKNFFK